MLKVNKIAVKNKCLKIFDIQVTPREVENSVLYSFKNDTTHVFQRYIGTEKKNSWASPLPH